MLDSLELQRFRRPFGRWTPSGDQERWRSSPRHLALAANRDLFDDALPLDFSEQAYQRLKRHKVPFAGAIKLVGFGLPRPRPEDPAYIRLRETKKDVLGRRFESIRSKVIDRLRALAATQQSPSSAADTLNWTVDFRAYGAVRVGDVGA